MESGPQSWKTKAERRMQAVLCPFKLLSSIHHRTNDF